MNDYTPKTNSAEWHITYKCDLNCTNCNRFCFLPPTTKDMTLDDARLFVSQCKELNWSPKIILMGGEPTLHKDIFEFVEIAKEITDDIEIYSNCFRPQSKPILRKLKKLGVKSPEWAYKPNGDVPLQNQNQMLAPIDFGVKNHGPCDWHSSRYYKDIGWNCGISVDSEGYSVCIVGGAVDGLLDLNLRTKDLKKIFDKKFAEYQTHELCNNCGACFDVNEHDKNHSIPDEVNQFIDKVSSVRGALVSPKYKQAIEDKFGKSFLKEDWESPTKSKNILM